MPSITAKHFIYPLLSLLIAIPLGLFLLGTANLWLVISVAVFAALLASWQAPCIKASLASSQPLPPSANTKPSNCAKHGLLRPTLYWLVVALLTTATALWWSQQKIPMNDSGLSNENSLHSLPYRYTSNKIRWQLGFATLPKFVTIPSGSFEMGSDSGSDDEKPVHTVTLANPFLMSQHEVSFAEYDYYIWSIQRYYQQLKSTNSKILKPQYVTLIKEIQLPGIDTTSKKISIDKNSLIQKEDSAEHLYYPYAQTWGRASRPVINVSWLDAQGYTNWLSKQLDQNCRLPTEAEWEYAARAGTTTKYPWGDTASHEHANYGKDECCDGLARGKDQWVNTSPVGSFPANDWGLYDMQGNAWEWVQDCYQGSYTNTPKDGSAQEVDQCELRVLRGGSWFNGPGDLRSAFRGDVRPDVRYDSVGFRVVCSHPLTVR